MGRSGRMRHLRPRVVARSAVEALERPGAAGQPEVVARHVVQRPRRRERAPARRRSACSVHVAVRGPDGPVRRDGDVRDVRRRCGALRRCGRRRRRPGTTPRRPGRARAWPVRVAERYHERRLRRRGPGGGSRRRRLRGGQPAAVVGEPQRAVGSSGVPSIRERSHAGNGNGENGDDAVRRRPTQLVAGSPVHTVVVDHAAPSRARTPGHPRSSAAPRQLGVPTVTPAFAVERTQPLTSRRAPGQPVGADDERRAPRP